MDNCQTENIVRYKVVLVQKITYQINIHDLVKTPFISNNEAENDNEFKITET